MTRIAGPQEVPGGIVTQKKENRSHRLQLHILKASEGDAFLKENQEKMIAAYQCILEGHEYRSLPFMRAENRRREKTFWRSRWRNPN